MKNGIDKRLHFLDGLRGWGALSVLLYHVFIEAFPLSGNLTSQLYRAPLFDGTLAVWVFFVVSGFSLSIHYCRTRDRDALVNIALGRYARLAVPILIVCLLLYLSFRLGLVVDVEDRPAILRTALTTAPSFRQTIQFALYDVFLNYPNASLIPPLWTMPIELWGSSLVIGTLFVVGSLQRRYIIYSILLFVAYRINSMYVAFLIGMVFAEFFVSTVAMQHKEKVGRVSALAFVLAILICWNRTKIPLPLGQVYLICATLLSFGVIFNGRLATLFSGRVSQFLGKISFPLYLIHAPLFYTYSSYLYTLAGNGISDSTRMTINSSTVVVSIVAAYFLVPIDKLGINAAKMLTDYLRRSRHQTRTTELKAQSVLLDHRSEPSRAGN